MKKKILVISQYYYPENFRITDLCKEWIKRGFEVTVITGIPNYPHGSFYKGYGIFRRRNEVIDGVTVKRVPIIPRGRSKYMLGLNYISFVISGFIWKIFTRVKADFCFIFEVSPMTQALPGVWFSKKRNIPCYLYVQDLWPDNVEIITGKKDGFLMNQISKMVDYIYENSTRIFVTSRSFINSIKNRGVSVSKIEYWPQYSESFEVNNNNCSYEDMFDKDKKNIIFTGNLGEAQGLEILIETCQMLDENIRGQVVFHLVGEGRNKDTLVEKVLSNELTKNIKFHKSVPSKEVPSMLRNADFAFISLKSNKLFEMTIPAKLQTYMSTGMPIIGSISGEVKSIIEESDAGYVCDAGDSIGLTEILNRVVSIKKEELDKFRNNSKNYYLQNFDKDKLLNQFDKYLKEI